MYHIKPNVALADPGWQVLDFGVEVDRVPGNVSDPVHLQFSGDGSRLTAQTTDSLTLLVLSLALKIPWTSVVTYSRHQYVSAYQRACSFDWSCCLTSCIRIFMYTETAPTANLTNDRSMITNRITLKSILTIKFRSTCFKFTWGNNN